MSLHCPTSRRLATGLIGSRRQITPFDPGTTRCRIAAPPASARRSRKSLADRRGAAGRRAGAASTRRSSRSGRSGRSPDSRSAGVAGSRASERSDRTVAACWQRARARWNGVLVPGRAIQGQSDWLTRAVPQPHSWGARKWIGLSGRRWRSESSSAGMCSIQSST